MNKAELLADLATKVEAVGDTLLIGIDAIANIRRYDVQVYVTVDADGTELLTTQRIHVHDENGVGEKAVYSSPLRKNFEEVVKVSGNEMVLNEINRQLTDGEILGFSFSHTINLANELKAGIFTITNLDSSKSVMAYSIMGDKIINIPYENAGV